MDFNKEILKQLNEGKNPSIKVDSVKKVSLLGSTLLKVLEKDKKLTLNNDMVSLVLSPENIAEVEFKADDQVNFDFAKTNILLKSDELKWNVLNKELSKEFNNVAFTVNGKELKEFSLPLMLQINMSNFKLTHEQQAGLIGIISLENNNNEVNGKFISNDIFEIEIYKEGKYGVLLANTLQKIILHIGKKEYTLNDKKMSIDVPPIIIEERTMVPIRFITEAFGGSVNWDESTHCVKLILNNNVFEMVIGQKNLEMDVPPIIIDNRTFVPLRYVSEQFGINVIWDEKDHSIELHGRI